MRFREIGGIEGYRLHHPGVDVEASAVEGETLRDRQLDLGAPFAIQMRELALIRPVGLAHEELCGRRGFGGGERELKIGRASCRERV